MPLYEYRCSTCGTLATALRPAAESDQALGCPACGAEAERIISRPSVHRSKASKVERLDPRYDRMVDKAITNTPGADPDRHLRRMKPFSDD